DQVRADPGSAPAAIAAGAGRGGAEDDWLTNSPTNPGTSPMPDAKLVAELAPTGVLRAAINMGNFLLVTGKAPSGDPTGVSPDMALAIGARLGVPVKFIPYARPGKIADDA